MNDEEITISRGRAIAWGAWAVAGVLLVTMWASGDMRAGFSGLAMVGVAATATIRTYFVAQGEQLRNAFELGRDSVRPIR